MAGVGGEFGVWGLPPLQPVKKLSDATAVKINTNDFVLAHIQFLRVLLEFVTKNVI
jgi:nitrate reductase beta subunit